MDKTTFDAIMKFYSAEYDAEKILHAKGLSIDETEEVLEPFWDCREKLLRIGKYLVEEEYVNKDTYITEDYERVQKYIRLNIIYEYDNGLALCENTVGSIYLVPQKLLANE